MATITYKYRIRRVLSDPDRIMDETRSGHRLYNDLVAIERKRREDTERFWAERGSFSELLDKRDAAIEAVESLPREQRDERKAGWAALHDLRQQIWDATRATEAAHYEGDPAKLRRKARAKELRAEAKGRGEKLTAKQLGELLDREPDCLTDRDKLRRKLVQEYRERGVAVSAKVLAQKLSEAHPAPTEHIEQEAKAAAYAAYRDRGITPGTRAIIQDAHKRSLDKLGSREQRFKAWDGRGSFGVQIQGGATYGELCAGTHGMAQLERVDDGGRYTPGSRRHGSEHRMRVRIGSDGRAPIWAEFVAGMLRRDPKNTSSTSDPIPPEAKVMQVRVNVERVGVHDRWTVCFVLNVPDHVYKRDVAPSKGGTVAVDIGWRSIDGGLRVGYWHDKHGHGSIDLPTIRKRLRPGGKRSSQSITVGVRDAFAHSQRLQGILSREFSSENKAAGVYSGALHDLATWLDERGRDGLPEWLAEATKGGVRSWRSQQRLNRLVERWLDNRFEGDSTIIDRLDKWRREWRHLHEWQARERDKALGVRDEHYRQVALHLARTYDTIVVNGANLAATRVRKSKGQAAPDLVMVEDAKRSQAFDAAPGKLREEILKAAQKYGRAVIKAAFDTVTCHACGTGCEWDRAQKLRHECEHCSAEWDQDANACRNALREWGGDGQSPGNARNGGKRAEAQGKTARVNDAGATA